MNDDNFFAWARFVRDLPKRWTRESTISSIRDEKQKLPRQRESYDLVKRTGFSKLMRITPDAGNRK